MSAVEGSDIRPNAKSDTELLVKRMQTLGGLAVFEGSRPLGGNAQQPRRLAILAVLARAGERGVSRDRLAGLLWGDMEGERARRSLNQALYALRQEMVAYADSARLALEEQIRAAPKDGQRRMLLGLALAYLGRKEEAEREAVRGVSLVPISRDAYIGPYNRLQLMRIYLLTGETEKALDQLEPLLRVPFYVSPGWLRLDPTFQPLQSNPRFQRLLRGG